MTSKEAQDGIGRLVTEDKVADVGKLIALRKTGGHSGRRSEYILEIQYTGTTRLVPISAVKWAKAEKAVPPVKGGVDQMQFIKGVRSLLLSGPSCFEGSPKEMDDQEAVTAYLFEVVFGRKPTAHELEYMSGATVPSCQRCQQTYTLRFTPTGGVIRTCKCTEALDKAFAQLT